MSGFLERIIARTLGEARVAHRRREPTFNPFPARGASAVPRRAAPDDANDAAGVDQLGAYPAAERFSPRVAAPVDRFGTTAAGGAGIPFQRLPTHRSETDPVVEDGSGFADGHESARTSRASGTPPPIPQRGRTLSASRDRGSDGDSTQSSSAGPEVADVPPARRVESPRGSTATAVGLAHESEVQGARTRRDADRKATVQADTGRASDETRFFGEAPVGPSESPQLAAEIRSDDTFDRDGTMTGREKPGAPQTERASETSRSIVAATVVQFADDEFGSVARAPRRESADREPSSRSADPERSSRSTGRANDDARAAVERDVDDELTINVSIGRIEVASRAATPPPVPARTAAAPRASLDDYLRLRARVRAR